MRTRIPRKRAYIGFRLTERQKTQLLREAEQRRRSLSFLLAEVCGYAAHRAAHRVPLLWRLHEVHHSIREMDRLAAPVRDAASPSGPYARPLRGRRGAALRLPPPAGVAVSPRSAGSPIAGGILVVAFSAARAATAPTA